MNAVAAEPTIWMVEMRAESAQGRSEMLDFEMLVEHYYQPLYRFALGLTHSEADASDLTHQTLLTWKTKGAQLRDSSKVKSWLFTTLHRFFLQSRRRESRFPHLELEKVDAELPSITHDGGVRLDSADVMNALSKMDDSFRAPLGLFYLEDYAYKDIAVILGIPLGTVKSRIARGIVQLQKMLATNYICSAERIPA